MGTLIGSFCLPRLDRQAAEGRHLVRQYAEKVLGYAGHPDVQDRADDVALAAAELLANAVMHGAGDQMAVRVLETGEVLRVEVQDAFQGEIENPAEDPFAESGRGLLLVQALTDRSGHWQDTSGTTFWFEVTATRPA